jgi:hypothetical protein
MCKVSKQSVDCNLGMKESHCGKAFEDVPPPSNSALELGTCEKVEGEISRVFWCRLFTRANSR